MSGQQHRLPSGLVDIVSGSFGAGHDAAAAEVAARFEARGYTTRTWDVVDLFPHHLGRVVRATYLRQLRVAPASWGTLLRHLETPGTLTRLAGRALATTSAGLLDIAADRPDVIVSTHPFASQALGRLRADGRLDVPVVTYLTDMSVHRLWVHPAVDLHLALHAVPAEQTRVLGGRVAVVDPVPVPRPRPCVAPREVLRASLGLPRNEPLALVTGGSLGIGQLERAAADVAATGLARPVVLCGHNAALHHSLRGREGVSSLAWRDDLASVLGAMDVVVQNAGGFTSREALAAGVPQLSYRCIPGHGESNAAALEEAGLVPWARTPEDLPAALGLALQARLPRRALSVPAGDLVDTVFPERARVPA